MPLNSELVARLLEPIPGDSPSGQDLRYDPRVDAIKEARREEPDLPGVTNRKLADWPTVVTACSDLLAKETKDLQLGVWLTEALLQKQGFAGLATGLQGLSGMLNTFWDTVHPLPEDDDLELRSGPLEFVGKKLAIPVKLTMLGASGITYDQFTESRKVPNEAEADSDRAKNELRATLIEQGKPTPESVDAAVEKFNKVGVRALLADLDLSISSLATLEKVSDEKFGRDAPAFNDLRNASDEVRRFLGGQLAWRNIEQQRRHAGIGEVGGNLRPHSSSPQHRRLLNPHIPRSLIYRQFHQNRSQHNTE